MTRIQIEVDETYAAQLNELASEAGFTARTDLMLWACTLARDVIGSWRRGQTIIGVTEELQMPSNFDFKRPLACPGPENSLDRIERLAQAVQAYKN